MLPRDAATRLAGRSLMLAESCGRSHVAVRATCPPPHARRAPRRCPASGRAGAIGENCSRASPDRSHAARRAPRRQWTCRSSGAGAVRPGSAWASFPRPLAHGSSAEARARRAALPLRERASRSVGPGFRGWCGAGQPRGVRALVRNGGEMDHSGFRRIKIHARRRVAVRAWWGLCTEASRTGKSRKGPSQWLPRLRRRRR